MSSKWRISWVTYPRILWITLLASIEEHGFPLGWALECCEMRQFDDGGHDLSEKARIGACN